MRYGYVTLVIGASQLGLAGLVAALDYSLRSRATAARLQVAISSATISRSERRVERTVAGARSLMWWKRLAAARTLTLLAEERDRGTILRLIVDSHPAVQSAATACLRRYADDGLLLRVIDGLSTTSSAVRTYQLGVLSEHSAAAAPILVDRIRADAPPSKLYAYIHAASVLNDAECMGRVADLSTHPHPEVRVAVARALGTARERGVGGEGGGGGGGTMHIKLLALLRDPDWRVRAQAARGLAEGPDQHTADELARALTDENWWVRFRAGLALATMGDMGQHALTAACTHTDRYARDMALLVGGLSDSSVRELSAG